MQVLLSMALRVSCLVLAEMVLFVSASAICLFGPRSDRCVYPCRCLPDSDRGCDSDTGECPRGRCWQGRPEGFPWHGPSCQVGNVAYRKQAATNGLSLEEAIDAGYNSPDQWYDPNNALNGGTNKRYNGGDCTIVFTDSGDKMAWWQVDLLDLHLVSSVSIINVDGGDASYLENFEIRTGRQSDYDSQDVCAQNMLRVTAGATVTFNCTDGPVTARYVSVKKLTERYKKGRLPLCEVIVTGRLSSELIDRNNCQTYSNDSLFCNQCRPGWKPPICHEPCANGSFGERCESVCHQCHNYDCEPTTGLCRVGCALWHVNDTVCDVIISPVDIVDPPTVLLINTTWVLLNVNLDHVIPQHLWKYYTVNVVYSEDPTAPYQPHNNTDIPVLSSVDESLHVTVTDLQPSTQYHFKLSVSRTHKNISDESAYSEPINVRLDDLPDPPPVLLYSTHQSGGLATSILVFIVVSSLVFLLGVTALAVFYVVPRVKYRVLSKRLFEHDSLESEAVDNGHYNAGFDSCSSQVILPDKYNLTDDTENLL